MAEHQATLLNEQSHPVTRRMTRLPQYQFVLLIAALSFSTYFCAYAFRKPFLGAIYEGYTLFGKPAKDVFMITQLVGYALAKFIGIKICSELKRSSRKKFLLGLILIAEVCLLLFAILPVQLKPIPMFFNGLMLGMVWGGVILYLEGRNVSEFLLAGVCCSYIVSTGVVKDVGRYLMNAWSVPEFWMPVLTGLIFLPMFFLAVWMLNLTPDPTPTDEHDRNKRRPMTGRERIEFVLYYAPGIVFMILIYAALTGLRDFRGAYDVNILNDLNVKYETTLLSRIELMVAFGAMSGVFMLGLFKVRKFGVIPNIVLMMIGLVLIFVSTWLCQQGSMNGFWWLVFVGMGGYLAYVPCNTVFFDRLLACSPFVGTAAFMAYVMDAGGYAGSIIFQLVEMFTREKLTKTQYLQGFCYIFSVVAMALLVFNLFYFYNRSLRKQKDVPMKEVLPETA